MRVTENALIGLAEKSVSRARERAANASLQMSSGTRVEKPSDDPGSWAAGARARVRTTYSQGRGEAIARSAERLADVDAKMNTIGSALTRAQELTVQLTNGSMSADERRSGAVELRDLMSQISGAEGSIEPNAIDIEVAEGQTARVTPNSDILLHGDGTSVLATLERIASAFEADNPGAARAELDLLEDKNNNIAERRTEVGSRMSTLISADDARIQFELNLEKQRARSLDVDPIAAASELASSSVALEGARRAAEQIIALARQG
jgi:flagellar hook-associated protein 3 FlgL